MSRCGDSPRLRFTKLPGVSHGGLARAFYISETYDWLFQHRLDDPDRPVNKDYDITTDRLNKAYKDIDRSANHLIVRNAQKTTSKKEKLASNETDATSGNTQYHTIRKGDTLGKIAKNYHTSVNTLCRLNNISANSVLRIGKRLRVK